jgi:hypothetical protein
MEQEYYDKKIKKIIFDVIASDPDTIYEASALGNSSDRIK